MPSRWANYVGSLHVPQIVKVGEHEEWRVHRGGRWVACSSKGVAESNAATYRKQGYVDVKIEYRIVVDMGEILP